MTGFDSKRQASKSLLEPQSAKEVANEQSYDTGLWFVATTASEAHLQAALRRLTVAVEGTHPDPWREAIDAELVCLHLGTVDSFPSANEALDALINWHIATALDPAVSASAKLLVDRGRAVAEPLTDAELLVCLVSVDPNTKRLPPGFKAFARAIEAHHGIGIKGSAA